MVATRSQSREPDADKTAQDGRAKSRPEKPNQKEAGKSQKRLSTVQETASSPVSEAPSGDEQLEGAVGSTGSEEISENQGSPAGEGNESNKEVEGVEERGEDQQTSAKEVRSRTTSSQASSRGPKFALPKTVPLEAIAAARLTAASGAPRGFDNEEGYMCYRNATVVMLLSSDRINSWIRHRYVPELKAVGLSIRTKVDGYILSKTPGDIPPGYTRVPYTDVLCELCALHMVYYNQKTTKRDLDRVMLKFWGYLSSEERAAELYPPWSEKSVGQQDAEEFLSWILALSVQRLVRFLVGLTDRESPSHSDKLKPEQSGKMLGLAVAGVDIHEIVAASFTTRIGCSGPCGKRNIPNRLETLDQTMVWSSAINDPSAGEGELEDKMLPLEEILEADQNAPHLGYLCEECQKEKEKRKARILEEAGDDQEHRKMVEEQWNIANIISGESPTSSLKRLCSLPEVLFISFKRFGHSQQTSGSGKKDNQKISTKVDLPSVIDVTPFLEKEERVPVRSTTDSTKYRLVAIASHRGTDRDSGHYVAEVKRRDDSQEGEAADLWCTVNDKRVSKTNLGKILKKQDEFTPYLLMFEKIPGDDSSEDGNGNNEEANSEKANSEKANSEVNEENNDRDPPAVVKPGTLPTYYDEDRDEILELDLATDHRSPDDSAGLDNRLNIEVRVDIGRPYRIRFPTYVLSNYRPEPARQSARINVRFTDPSGSLGEISGEAAIVPRRAPLQSPRQSPESPRPIQDQIHGQSHDEQQEEQQDGQKESGSGRTSPRPAHSKTPPRSSSNLKRKDASNVESGEPPKKRQKGAGQPEPQTAPNGASPRSSSHLKGTNNDMAQEKMSNKRQKHTDGVPAVVETGSNPSPKARKRKRAKKNWTSSKRAKKN